MREDNKESTIAHARQDIPYLLDFTCGENEDGSTFEDVKIFPRT
jgi:hypothetical protein